MGIQKNYFGHPSLNRRAKMKKGCGTAKKVFSIENVLTNFQALTTSRQRIVHGKNLTNS